MFDSKRKYGVEIDEKGRELGTGPPQRNKILNIIIFILNYVVLTILIGSGFSYLLMESPLFLFFGGLIGFVLVLVGRLVTGIFYLISGDGAPFKYFWDSPFLGTPELRGICSVALILFIPLTIGLRVYRSSYVPPGTDQYILIGNAVFFIVCTMMLSAL